MEIKTVRINAGKGYDVVIGGDLLYSVGGIIGKSVKPCRAAVITDSTVEKLFLGVVTESLESAGFSVCAFSFPAGEKSKTLMTLSDILEFLAEKRLTRSDCVVALGGGVVGDISGFAAGCYLRGIKYVQIPTTFLSAVDSSVGGKTAVDLTAGKNLAGLFIQPETVVCDADCLGYLSDDIFADGAAEAIKTGVLSGEKLFGVFESGDVKEALTDIIAGCVSFKGRVVEEDEFEKGPRRMLNLGHTVGHAIEKCSGYTVAHGHAVSAGLAVIARAADRLGLSSSPLAPRIENALIRNGLPVSTDFSPEKLAEAALSDKKRAGDEITLIIPRSIGDCYPKTISVGELRAVIEAGSEVT